MDLTKLNKSNKNLSSSFYDQLLQMSGWNKSRKEFRKIMRDTEFVALEKGDIETLLKRGFQNDLMILKTKYPAFAGHLKKLGISI